jgi:hypothetical protein
MASAPPPKRILRPRTQNIKKSYKNTCGAPAPRGSLTKRSQPAPVVTKPKPKKAPVPVQDSGRLIYTTKGPKLPLGAVSDVTLCH